MNAADVIVGGVYVTEIAGRMMKVVVVGLCAVVRPGARQMYEVRQVRSSRDYVLVRSANQLTVSSK